MGPPFRQTDRGRGRGSRAHAEPAEASERRDDPVRLWTSSRHVTAGSAPFRAAAIRRAREPSSFDFLSIGSRSQPSATPTASRHRDWRRAWRIFISGLRSCPESRRSQPPAAVAMSAQELTRYAGIYRPIDDPWNLWPIEVRQGVLGEIVFDDAADEAFYPMTPAGDGRFFEVGRTGNVGLFVFRPSASGGPPRLEVSWTDGPIEVSERITDSAVWRPSAAALAEYAGTWFSPDLDAGWQLETRGARLELRRRGQVDLTLRPVARDRFLRGFGPDGEVSVRLQFHRDSAGRLSELTASTPAGEASVRNLRFTRLAVK